MRYNSRRKNNIKEEEMLEKNEKVGLDLHQKFELTKFKLQVNEMTMEQAKILLVEVYELHLSSVALYKELLKKSWGMGD